MSFPRKLSALAVASTMAVTGVTMATPALANTGTSSQPAAATPAINQVHKETGYFKTTDKLGTQLFYRKDIVPNAKGAVVLVHGLMENSSNYEYLTKSLTNAGYSVYRFDNRGHGRSAAPYINNAIPRGQFDDWWNIESDIHQVVGTAHKENTGKKVFLLGHSMGGIAVQSYGIMYPGTVDGIVSSGGGTIVNVDGPDTEGATTITPDNLNFFARHALPQISQLLPMAQLTSFNGCLVKDFVKNPKAIRMPSGPLSADIILPGYPPYGLCSDPAVRFDHWHRDPLYNHYMRLGLVEQMGVAEAYNVMNAHDFKAPTLIMHGENDGLVPSYFDVNWYNAITSKDKKIIQWHGLMHEIFNEPTKDQVIKTTIDWIDAHNK